MCAILMRCEERRENRGEDCHHGHATDDTVDPREGSARLTAPTSGGWEEGLSGKQCKQARVTPNLFFGSSGNGSWFAWCGRKRPPSSSSDRYTHKTVTFFSFWTLGASAPRGMGAWRLAAACAWAVGLGGQRCRASTLLIREAGGDPVALDYGTCVFKCEWRAIERRRGRVSKVSRRNVYLVLTWARSAISALWAHFPLVARRPIKTTRRA